MFHKAIIGKDKTIFLILWMSVSILGWLLVPINALDPNLRTYMEVGIRALVYTACGLFIGLIIGAGQFLVLKHKLNSPNNWFVLTLAGYALAWPVGLLISTLISTIAFSLQSSSFLPLIEPSKSISYFPFPFDIIMGGWVVGITQWIGLRQILQYRTFHMAALWVLGVWLSIGLGIFTPIPGVARIYNANLNMVVDPILAMERIKIGLISGLVTGLLLLLIINANNQRSGQLPKP
jgi:hypothetical protein